MRSPRQRTMRQLTTARHGASYLILLLGSITFLIPFLWMVTTSLKPKDQIYQFPPVWIPNPPIAERYVLLLQDPVFMKYLLNTVIIAVIGVAGSLIGSSIAAYAFARMRFPGRDILFFIMIATMMVPQWVTIIPSYIIFGRLQWLDTYLPILVPAFFATPFNTFLLRQFFLAIPREIEDAAKVDGASTTRIFLTIMLPLARPALLVVSVFAFVYYWNEFLTPLIYLSSQDKFPISLGILNFVGQYQTDFGMMMAAATVAIIPCVAVFFLMQRWFIQGIVVSGVKG